MRESTKHRQPCTYCSLPASIHPCKAALAPTPKNWHARSWPLDVQVSVLTAAAAASPQAARQAGALRVLPAVEHWDWRLGGMVGRIGSELGVDWIHVQYQTAAYGMNPAINFAPWQWRRQGLRVAWTYHDLLVPYLFPKAGQRLRTWVTERPAHLARRTIVTNEADRLPIGGERRDRDQDTHWQQHRGKNADAGGAHHATCRTSLRPR